MLKSKLFIVLPLILPILSIAQPLQPIAEKTKNAIYTVKAGYAVNGRAGQGSAVAIGPNLLVTNCHVTQQKPVIWIYQGSKLETVKQVFADEEKDLCLLKSEKANLQFVDFRPENSIEIGEPVFTIGSPLGQEQTISYGNITGRSSSHNNNWFVSDARIKPGSSGGGLFDKNGKLIGITTRASDSVSFAFPVDSVMDAYTLSRTKEYEHKSETYDSQQKEVGWKVLGDYGGNNIQLLKYNNQCFVSFNTLEYLFGKHPILLFNPTTHYLIFFASKHPYKEPNELLLDLLDKTSQGRMVPTKSYLTLDRKNYVLIEAILQQNPHIVYIAQIPKEYSLNSLSQTDITATIYLLNDDSKQEMQLIRFSTFGLDQAASDYLKKCQN